MKTLIGAALAVLLPAAAAFAQQPEVDARPSRFQLGPLGVTPRLFIQNLGVDTNVFNSPDSPVKDLTAVVTPGVDLRLRMNRLLVTSRTTTNWVHYQTSASQRSFDFSNDWRVDVDLISAVPRIGGVYIRTRQRPNEEIDERVQQKVMGGGVGVTVPIGVRWHLDLDAKRTSYDYSQGQYGDEEVAEALNRDSDHVTVATKVELTPLTSFGVRVESIRDRFVFTPDRDSDSIRVMPGFTFRPFALISGSAYVGVRHFETIAPHVPDYTGLVAAVELKYVLRDMFRLSGRFTRDVDYSLDLNEPFLVSTSVNVEAMQMIGFNWDVVMRAGRTTLSYPFTPAASGPRTDRLQLWGVGLGRRLGDDLRVGADVNYVSRWSVTEARSYKGLRFGGSVTYGY